MDPTRLVRSLAVVGCSALLVLGVGGAGRAPRPAPQHRAHMSTALGWAAYWLYPPDCPANPDAWTMWIGYGYWISAGEGHVDYWVDAGTTDYICNGNQDHPGTWNSSQAYSDCVAAAQSATCECLYTDTGVNGCNVQSGSPTGLRDSTIVQLKREERESVDRRVTNLRPPVRGWDRPATRNRDG